MNFTWYLHITPGHITTYKQLNFLFNYSNIRWESESERKRMTKTKKDFIFLTFDGVEINVQTKKMYSYSLLPILFMKRWKKKVLHKNVFLKLPNLKRKLSTWIVFFTEIMIYSVKLINHILTFLVKMRANILTIQPQ